MMMPDTQNRYEPIDKLDELTDFLKEHDPEVTDISENSAVVTLKSGSGTENNIGIDLGAASEGEITLFFGGWHKQYSCYGIEGYSDFGGLLEDLDGILNNRKFAVCTYIGGQWFGSEMAEGTSPNEELLRRKWGDHTRIVCSFRDSGNDTVFEARL